MKRLVTGCLCSALAACLAAAAPQSAPATVNGSVSRVSDWAPPAVRIPTGLISDAGDREALLEWNPGLEKTLAGYFAYRQDAKGQAFRKVNATPLAASEFADKNLANGRAVRYRVAAVLKSGVESKPSTEVQVMPRGVSAPAVKQGAVDLNVPGFDRIAVRNATSVRFENGHNIVFDRDMARLRPVDRRRAGASLFPVARLGVHAPIGLRSFHCFTQCQLRPPTV